MRAIDRRMNKLCLTIAASPAKRHLLQDAYEWFKGFGELPEPPDQQLACEVVLRALRGGNEHPVTEEEAEDIKCGATVLYRARKALDAGPPSVRAMLFEEALFAHPRYANLARAQIASEVLHGGDVESRAFAAHRGLPMFGSIALYIAGWPRNLALPPYEAQARRLFARLDNLRGRVDQDDPRWFDEQAQMAVRFLQTGELPKDELHFECVLIDVELDLLAAHKRGEDVSIAMDLFDKLAQERDEETRLQALNQIRAMAAEGRFCGSGGWASEVPAT